MISKNKCGLRIYLLAGFLWLAGFNALGANVLTFHNDNARTGRNTNETILTPVNVASTNFGQLFSYALDGYVYAQPLVVTNVSIPGKGVHDVVYVATEHDSVYAFDANSNTPATPLWQVSFINPATGTNAVSHRDIIGPAVYTDVIPEIGITSTPVIDVANGTIYVSAKTKMTANNVTTYYDALHALDLGSGAEKFGGPAIVQPTVPGTGDGSNTVTFNPLMQFNRAALLLNNGIVYIPFASHADFVPYHGWLIGFNESTLRPTNLFNTTPNGGMGGIWQAGGGPATDTNNNIYFMTSNGTFDGTNCFGETFVKLTNAPNTNILKVADYFTPFDQDYRNNNDRDLGSGGLVVLPDEAGGSSSTNKHLIIGSGKSGADNVKSIYLINRDGMGNYNPTNNNQIVQCVTNAIGSSFDVPAYFNNKIYYLGAGDSLKAFSITNGHMSTSAISQGPTAFGFPGATPSISANGTNNAIAWVVQTDDYDDGPAVLRAYNATNVAVELYNSSAAGNRDLPGIAVKFAVPTIANGKVYVTSKYTLSVFGLGTFLTPPVISPAGTTFTNSISVSISTAAGTTIHYTLDGSMPTASSTLYAAPFILTSSASVQARAFSANAVPSPSTIATFMKNTDIGTGTGLSGTYYSNQLLTFSNPPAMTRTDAVVNFNWSGGSPDPSVSANNFTVMWTGGVQPQFNETYTFYVDTDDGVRLWVNGQLLVDEWWLEQSTFEWGTSIALNAGQTYSITMEYCQYNGNAIAQLYWSSPSTPKVIIPQTQLYPSYPPMFLPVTHAYANGNFQLQTMGMFGKGYILQVSTNLTSWTSIQTNSPAFNPSGTLPTNVFNFSDPAAPNFPFRFYRVQQWP